MTEKPALHPIAIELAFPRMEPAEFAGLADSVEREGLRHPVVFLEGMILDGDHRWDACAERGVEIRTREFGSDPHDGDDPEAFVLRENFHRRHLSKDAQKAFADIVIARHPDWSSHRIAAETGLSDKTVEKMRNAAPAPTAENPQLSSMNGVDHAATAENRSCPTVPNAAKPLSAPGATVGAGVRAVRRRSANPLPRTGTRRKR